METHLEATQPVSLKYLSGVTHLNALLRGELSALEAYSIVLRKVRFSPLVLAELEQCQESHLERREALIHRIELIGGEPATTSGAWGTFAKVVEGSAAGLGSGPALVILGEGEGHGYRSYEKHMKGLDPELEDFVARELFPKQQATSRILERLRLGTG